MGPRQEKSFTPSGASMAINRAYMEQMGRTWERIVTPGKTRQGFTMALLVLVMLLRQYVITRP